MKNLKVGTKFNYTGTNGEYTIINITETRVIYTDGRVHSFGASNRKQSSSWMTTKGLERKILSGELSIIE